MKASIFVKVCVIFLSMIINGFEINAQQPTYKFIKKISLPNGNGKWDYLKLDEKSNRLFVSHGDRVHIIDLKTELPIGEISGLKGVHGVALAHDLKKGYISNGTDNAITVFDVNTFSVITTIMVEGKKADAILYDKSTQRIFVFNNGSGDAIAIDAKTDKVVGKIALGGAPEFAVSNGKGSIFNNNEESNDIIEFDATSLAIKNRFLLSPNKVPTGLAYDKGNNYLFSVCRDPKTLVIVDASNGKIIQTLPIGGGTDAVVYDAKNKLVMASNGEGNVTIVKQNTPTKYTIIQTLQTQKGIKTMALNSQNHQIYLSGADLEADGKTPIAGTFGVFIYGLQND